MAVQQAVKEALENRGLHTELVDHGFDYEVTLETGDIAEGALRFEVGPYLLEIKATTEGDVRLTPAQAEMATTESERYILCVVDLRSVSKDRLALPWIAADVEPILKVVPDIGKTVAGTWMLVDMARSNAVELRNEKALRYSVSPGIWEPGISAQ